MKNKIFSVILMVLAANPLTALGGEMKIKITTGENTITATLEDNPTAKEFLTLLPLKLTLKDYNKTEKIADLPRKLTVAGAPTSITPKAGDIAFYAPWGNLAIFYKGFKDSPGLIRLGKIDSGLDFLAGSNAMDTTIEVIPNPNGAE